MSVYIKRKSASGEAVTFATVPELAGDVDNDRPLPLGDTAYLGMSANAARADHVHKKPTPADIGASDDSDTVHKSVDGEHITGYKYFDGGAEAVTLTDVQDSTSKIATTAWVHNYTSGGNGVITTLDENLVHKNVDSEVITGSKIFTKVITAKTPEEDSNSTDVATTEWVQTIAQNAATATATKAPIYHASQDTTYGIGLSSVYGHVKLSDSVSSSNMTASSGVAATPSAVKTAYDKAVSAFNLANAATFPKGTIVMWAGATSSIPSGWAICNGSGGTVDLRDRFIVGAGSSYGLGYTGGANYVTPSGSVSVSVDSAWLSTGQMAAHSHYVSNSASHEGSWYGGGGAWLSIGDGGGRGWENYPHYTSTDGGSGQAHAHGANASFSGNSLENRPPYYALYFIQKIS